MPKVSVIIQCWQDRGFIDDAIRSALNQTFDDYEVIVSSDGNYDIKEYADKYKIPFCMSSKENHSASVNKAINQSKGQWIKVIDDDDMILPNCLEDLYNARGDYDLIQANAKILKDDGIHIYKGRQVTARSLLPLINNPINWSTVMFKKESFLSFGGFDPGVHFANDYDLYLNFLRHGFKIGYCDSVVSCYRLHSLQMSKMATYYKRTEKEYLAEKYRLFIHRELAKVVNDDMGLVAL